MKKGLFTLLILVMAFGNLGFAQKVANLRTPELKTVMSHYGLRAEGDMPETAVWRHTNGYEQKRIYTYDEYDFYLTEVLEQAKVGGNWVNDELVTYDYGFDGEVLEVYDKAWFEEQWYDIGWATYTYNQNEMEVVYQFRDVGEDWQNYLKEVYNYNDDVTTILFWTWNGTTWSSSELHTYTYGITSIDVLKQYMQGGAWQNDEKETYTLDFDGNVTEILVEKWMGVSWVNETRTIYSYEAGVFLSKRIEEWNGTSWEDAFMFHYSYDDGNATYGECLGFSMGEWVSSNGTIEMAYGYNADSKYYSGCEVNATYFDVTGIGENTQSVNFLVYPVPAQEEIHIEAEGFQKAEIYSLTGQKLMESLCDKMNVSNLSSGLYVMKVYDCEGGCATQRFVVK